MNKLLLGAAFILSASAPLVLSGCAPQKNVMVDLGDVDDYQEFLEDRADQDAPKPFKPEPLYVSATGKVRAQPDIAVIIATISAEDKNESLAVDNMSKIINRVQDTLSARKVETGFTGISSRREFDEACQNANQSARQRHSQISSDYWFNRRLDQRGDKDTKRRPAKDRILQRECAAQTIKVSTQMVIRIQPASAAGDALRALSDAGAEDAQLFGYDFTDYDALYQEAAAKAVKMARTKAETTASLAGATLGEIETFTVSAPERTSRFGPQPNVIRPARPYRGQSGSVVDRQMNRRNPPAAPSYRSANPPAQSSATYDDQIIVTAARQVQEYETVNETVTQEARTVTEQGWDESVTERIIPVVTKIVSHRVLKSPGAGPTTNALSMSLLSGPQTISVTANLSYDYETPLDGKIIMQGGE